MNATDNYENLLAQWTFGASAPSRPTTLTLALLTGAPTDAGGGVEVSGGAYARVAIPQGTGWTLPSGGSGQVINASVITYPTATAAWGSVTHFALYDAQTGGNMLIWGQFDAAKTIAASDVFTIAAGALKITFA